MSGVLGPGIQQGASRRSSGMSGRLLPALVRAVLWAVLLALSSLARYEP